jgi:hypothetical protein
LGIFTNSKPRSHEYFHKQQYTTSTQSGEKCNPIFLGDKKKTEKTKMATDPRVNILAELQLKYHSPCSILNET